MKKYALGDAGICTKCGKEITITARMLKKSTYCCVPCKNLWAKTERGKVTMANAIRQWGIRNKDRRAQHHAKYSAANPQKRDAKQMLRNAVRRGEISRAPCVVCGNPLSHGHHDNYERPIDVVWLCVRHHVERHQSLLRNYA